MFKTKIIIATAILACAASALSAAPASAVWFVNGTALTTTAKLATNEVVDEIPTLLLPSVGIVGSCSGGILDNVSPEIIAGNSVKAQALHFLGCQITTPAHCLINETITTTPITAVASLGPGEEVRVVYLPQTKNNIASLDFNEENTCAFNGLEPVTGSIVDGVPNGQLEGASETLVGLGSVENNSLLVDGDRALIDGGKALVKLASGSKWSFR